MPERIYFAGIDETRAALKELGDIESTREFKAAGKAVANDVVIPAARAEAAGWGRLQERAAETLKAASIATGGALRFGGGFAAALGAEFGAMRDQRRNTARGVVYGWNQFLPWRGSSGDAGYFLWPAIRQEAPAIVEKYATELGPLWKRLFPEEG